MPTIVASILTREQEFQVLQADDARLRESGIEPMRPEPTRGADGCRVQFVHPKSTGGVLVELSEKDRP